jgi:hypothetical protein
VAEYPVPHWSFGDTITVPTVARVHFCPQNFDTLAAHGFFPDVLLCQFFGFWQEIGFGVTYLRI